MRTLLTLSLAALLTLAASASSALGGEIKIAWYGQSMFQVVTPKGTKIFLDPHNIEEYRITPTNVDLVLMSHLHNDHNQIEGVVKNAKEAKQFNAVKKAGPNDLVQEWNLIDEKFSDVRFFSVATYHDNKRGMDRGKNGCWVLDVDGVRIVHLGDLGHTLNKEQLKKIGEVDVVMVPAGGVYTIDGIQAFTVAQSLKPKRYIIPMHYSTLVYRWTLDLSYFTDEVKEAKVPIETVKDRKWLTIDTKAPAPKRASVALMSYMGPGLGEIEIKAKDKDKAKDGDK